MSERLYERVHPYLSQAAEFRASLRVEAALAAVPAEHGVCPDAVADGIARACELVRMATQASLEAMC